MTDTKSKTKKAFVIHDFTDSGTGESFEAGSTPMIEVGAFANYEAGGLIRTPTADEAKSKASN